MSEIESFEYFTPGGSDCSPSTPGSWMHPSSERRYDVVGPTSILAKQEPPNGLDERIISALEDKRYAWHTPTTIGQELGLPTPVVAIVVEELLARGEVRHPVGDRTAEQDMYRLSSRPYTASERVRMWRERRRPIDHITPKRDSSADGPASPLVLVARTNERTSGRSGSAVEMEGPHIDLVAWATTIGFIAFALAQVAQLNLSPVVVFAIGFIITAAIMLAIELYSLRVST